jgi:hypothetical protein
MMSAVPFDLETIVQVSEYLPSQTMKAEAA